MKIKNIEPIYIDDFWWALFNEGKIDPDKVLDEDFDMKETIKWCIKVLQDFKEDLEKADKIIY